MIILNYTQYFAIKINLTNHFIKKNETTGASYMDICDQQKGIKYLDIWKHKNAKK